MVELLFLIVGTAIGAFIGTSWAIRQGEKRRERLVAEQEAD